MYKKSMAIVLVLLTVIVAFSGCTTKKAPNGTFGEKEISLDAFKMENVTADHLTYDETLYYYVTGNITNKNGVDAIDVKMEAIAYDENGAVVAANNTPRIVPKNIPAQGTSYFIFFFTDPDNRIVRYEIKIIEANPIFN